MKVRLVEGAKSFDSILIHLCNCIFIFFSSFLLPNKYKWNFILFLATTFDLLEIDRWRIEMIRNIDLQALHPNFKITQMLLQNYDPPFVIHPWVLTYSWIGGKYLYPDVTYLRSAYTCTRSSSHANSPPLNWRESSQCIEIFHIKFN